MDPINLLSAIILFVSMSANYSGAKKGLKTSITKVVERPSSYLQKWPPAISAIILLVIILSIFNIGTSESSVKDSYLNYRYAGLAFFAFFSWMQVYSFKSLKEYYSQDIVIMKGHTLLENGPYKFIRHPQYLSQVLSDLGAAVALVSYAALPLVLLVELPLFILRGVMEDKLLAKHFGNTFANYKKKTGFFIPFIG